MNLVVQGPGADAGHASALAKLSRANAIEQAGALAYRLRGATPGPSVYAYCREHGLDCAFRPEGLRFDQLKLLAMDMDSTLITIECIDEIGDLAGKKLEIAALTAQAMRGEIDYPQSLRKRLGLIAGLGVEALHRVYDERLRLTPGAETLIQACKKHDVKLLLVSGGFNFFTDRLKQRLGFDYTLSSELEMQDGKLTGGLVGDIVDAAAKATFFRVLAHALGAPRQTVAIGDGANDLLMMAQAGTSVAFRAKPVVQAKADCALNYCGLDGVIHLFE